MPYLCAVFDNATQAVITEAATRFAESSPFTFEKDTPFHVPLIGGLHVYPKDKIAAAVVESSSVTTAPVEGRFLRWDASSKSKLRIVVELADHDGLVAVSSALPLGREWRDELYVEVGSLATVDRANWANFIEAVTAAFPITESSRFTISHLDFIEMKRPPRSSKPAAKPAAKPAKKLNPDAPAFKPQGAVSKRPARRALPRNKWVRPGLVSKGVMSLSAMDLETGHTGRRHVAIGKNPNRPNAGASGAASNCP
mmetsp:Transcript_66210/g.181518  ORF Transcript_66210/g.181518 Transcript_66210/m.181518 type:complete len:254 (-) Transcript_66210:249-1010(-)